MQVFHVPDWVARLNAWATWHGDRKKNSLHLTFDDGPHPEITPQVLRMLAKHQAKATFFCSGKQAEKHPELIKAILDGGHTIGNHGYAHLNGKNTSTDVYLRDIDKSQAILQSRLFRPPYGKITRKQRRKLMLSYQIVMWDVMPYDFDSGVNKEMAWDKTRKYIKPGSIVVLHETPKAREKMLYLLDKILVYYAVGGMRFEGL